MITKISGWPLIILLGSVFILFIVWYSFRIFKMKNGISNIQQLLIQIEKEDVTVEQRLGQFNEWTKEQKLPLELTDSWKRYYRDFNKREASYIPDIYDYFTEDLIVQKYGLRKFVESVPAIFVSFGILGTFLGITAGIQDIDYNAPSEEMMDGIKGLLSGMKVAFYSSIAGIFLSLITSFLDRSYFYRTLQNSFYQLRFSLDEAFPIKTDGQLLEELVTYQKDHMEDLKTFLADEMVAKMTSGLSDVIVNGLNPQFEKNYQIMEQIVHNTSETQSDKLNEMVKYFVNSLQDLAGEQMQEFGNTLSRTIEWQEKVHSEMNSLVTELKDSATKQSEMVVNTTKLTEGLDNFVDTFTNHHDKMNETITEIVAVTDQNKDLQNGIIELIGQVTNERKESQEQFKNQMETLTNNFDGLLEKVVEERINLSEQLKGQMEVIADGFTSLLHKVIDERENTGQQFKDQMQTLTNGIQGLLEKVIQDRENLDHQFKGQLDVLKDGIGELLDKVTNERITSELQFNVQMGQLSSGMDEIIGNIKDERSTFDQEFRSQMDLLSTNINKITNQSELLQDVFGDLQTFVSRFNETTSSLNELTRSNEQLSSTLKEQVQYTNESTDNLKDVVSGIANNNEVYSDIQKNMESLLNQMISERENLDNVKSQMLEQMRQEVLQAQKRFQELKSFWTQNTEKLTNNQHLFAKLNDKLDNSMEQFAEHMHQGLDRTFSQFDKQLADSVHWLDRGVSSINSVVKEMDKDITKINKTIKNFHNAIEEVATTKE
ncbi:MAG: anti-phage ZorAB system protein ZorA [Bacillota bacterium]